MTGLEDLNMVTYITADHEWIRLDAQSASVGLTKEAVKGDVVYIELPAVGLQVKKGEPCAKVESIKAVSDVHAPVDGMISAVNDSVFDDPDSVAQMGTWLFKVDFESEADTRGWTKMD